MEILKPMFVNTVVEIIEELRGMEKEMLEEDKIPLILANLQGSYKRLINAVESRETLTVKYVKYYMSNLGWKNSSKHNSQHIHCSIPQKL